MTDAEARRDAYLARLGLGSPVPVDLDGLRRLHRAHVARIAYDNVSIMLGRPDPAEPEAAAERAAAGRRVGYCFQQNAALEWLLRAHGFSVSRRHGHVWGRPGEEYDTTLNHLVLVVSGLPDADNPGGHWWVDAGLGEGFAEPLPLVRGDHDVDGWRFGIGAGFGAQAAGRPTGPAAWTYRHLDGGVIRGVVVTSRDHGAAALTEAHRRLSTAADSPFRRIVVAQRIERGEQRAVRNLVHHVLTPAGRTTRDLTTYEEWRAALADDLLVPLDDVGAEEWAALWDRSLASHRAWDEAGRP